MEKIKQRYSDSVKRIVDEGGRDAEDKVKNQTQIQQILIIGYVVKISILIVLILNLAYFFGLFFFALSIA
jgi:hypothetical protein